MNRLGFEETKEFKERQALSGLEIEEMKNYADFQSHTIYHPILPLCSDQRAFSEIKNSKVYLEQKFNFKIYGLSYPNGDYSKRDILIAKKAGYECAVTTESGYNSSKTDLFKLKRIAIPNDADKHEILVRAAGIWDFFRALLKLNI